jgi:hypothetical protein
MYNRCTKSIQKRKNETFLIFGKYKIDPPSNHKAVSPGAAHTGTNYRRVATILRLQNLKRFNEPRGFETLSFRTCLIFDPQKYRNLSRDLYLSKLILASM